MTMPTDSSPLPRLTVNIGVTGHRHLPAGSEPALRQQVAAFLRLVQEQVRELLRREGVGELVAELYAAAPESPRFVLLSSLAEGADSLVAEEALALGYELHSVLPMAREEYERDFETPESLATFRRLLGQVEKAHLFEIVAANPERGHAYADAAAVSLNHSDVLLALWDGKESGYLAGTAPTVELASRRHIPTIHLSTDLVTPTCILTDGERHTNWEERLQRHFRSLLLPVEALSDEADLAFTRACARQTPVSEREWFFRFLGLPGLFFRSEKAVGSFIRWVAPCPQQAEEVQGLKGEDAFVSKHPGCAEQLRGHFTRFDTYSNAYSARYRSGLFWRYLAPVIAMVFLSCALYWKIWFPERDEASLAWWMLVWFSLQALFLFVPLILQFCDTHRMWHRKFFSYRVVGEQLRQTMHLGALGLITVRSRESNYSDSPQRWTAWYYRALMRHEGLPAATVDRSYLLDWMLWTRNEFVVNQLNYHARRWRREGNMRVKLVWLGVIMFALGIAAALLRAGLTVMGCPAVPVSLVSVATMIFPSVAVFFAGFCAYACYAKNQQVSMGSSSILRGICREMDGFLSTAGHNIPQAEEASDRLPRPLHFTHAYKLAEQVDACCKGELLGWEELVSTRAIKGH